MAFAILKIRSWEVRSRKRWSRTCREVERDDMVLEIVYLLIMNLYLIDQIISESSARIRLLFRYLRGPNILNGARHWGRARVSVSSCDAGKGLLYYDSIFSSLRSSSSTILQYASTPTLTVNEETLVKPKLDRGRKSRNTRESGEEGRARAREFGRVVH
jgi:hypothetical protein